MTRIAAPVFQPCQELTLTLHFGRNAVSSRTRSREIAFFRHTDERCPIACGIILCRRTCIRSNDGCEVQVPARCSLRLLRIDKAVATYPNVVCGLRQVGYEVPSAIIGHHNFREACGQIDRFSDHPDTSLGSFRACDEPADVVIIDGDCDTAGLRSAHREGNEQAEQTYN